MKRDMELVRKMVLLMEDQPDGWAPREFDLPGYTDGQIGYHAYLLVNSGLATGDDVTNTKSSGPEYMLSHLTSAGHDFAESARTQYIWDEVMVDMREKGIASAALEVVKKALDARIRKKLNAD